MFNMLHVQDSLSQVAGASSAFSYPSFWIFLGAVIFSILGLIVLTFAGMWQVYRKAKVPGWAVLVPFYGKVRMLEFTGRPLWWIFLLVVPFVNIVIAIIVVRRLAAVFGHGRWFTVGLIFLPFIFYPILGFGDSKYKNTFGEAPEMSKTVKYSLIAAFVTAVLWTTNMSGYSGIRMPLVTLGEGYAADSSYVYYDDTLLPDASPYGFHVEGPYGYDHHSVYYYGDKVYHADARTFEVIDGDWAKDALRVYNSGDPIPDADPNTFEVVLTDGDGSYAMDNSHVFSYDGSVIEGADLASFEVLRNGYAKDKAHVYMYGDVIKGANASTFELESDPDGMYDAKDKNHYYYYGQVVDLGN